MEISVKVIKILDAQTFNSKNGGEPTVKNTFVGETAGQYPKKIAFTVMGADKFNQMGIVVGNTYNVSFDVESREWNDKWFTDAKAWRVVNVDANANTQQAPQTNVASPTPAPTPQPQASKESGENKDDLPF